MVTGRSEPGLRCRRDWNRANGEQIELAVIRHLASRPKERIGSMFINQGGPGDTGVGPVRGWPRRT